MQAGGSGWAGADIVSEQIYLTVEITAIAPGNPGTYGWTLTGSWKISYYVSHPSGEGTFVGTLVNKHVSVQLLALGPCTGTGRATGELVSGGQALLLTLPTTLGSCYTNDRPIRLLRCVDPLPDESAGACRGRISSPGQVNAPHTKRFQLPAPYLGAARG